VVNLKKLWILSAWHNFICETSVFLVNDDCLKLAGIDPGKVTVEKVQRDLFRPEVFKCKGYGIWNGVTIVC